MPHRTLDEGGLLTLDRDLPFLIVYREPADRADPGTARLVATEAAFLIADAAGDAEAVRAARTLALDGSARHGAFLLLELWSSPDPESRTFVLHAPDGPAPETIGGMYDALRSLTDLDPTVYVHLELTDDRTPDGFEPLLTIEESWRQEILLLGLEVPAIFRDPESGQVFPVFLRRLQRALSHALRRAIYEFMRVQTRTRVEHHLALGTHTPPEAVWEIDRELHALERSFDMLLLTSPIDQESAWTEFEANGFERNPDFSYRLLPLDPDLLKRRLYGVEIERVEDPAIAALFDDKRQELDTRLTMLRERGSADFRYGSMRLYGTVDERLKRIAGQLLDEVPRPRRWGGEPVDAAGFLAAAQRELEHYRASYPPLSSTVEVRRDVTGLMVSEGNLLIGETLSIRPDRVMPLIHHEVGTHVLTYVNGSAQPLEQLALGLADYDEFQEGLAVLAEYLVGGLDGLRMRLLAARVLAADSVEKGADFVETFRMLTKDLGYSGHGAWHITVRVHASGGFTRDLVYLRGLVDLLELLRSGAEIEPLYIGKIARKHLPVLEELRHRDVLREPPLLPRFLNQPESRQRLQAVRDGLTLTEMICRDPE